MKKIIDGKRYDTNSAKEIGKDWSSVSMTDFAYWEETLYQKRTGEYFLYGEGGPMSKYAVSCGQNEWSGGAKIIPLSYESARAWAEEHLGVDEFEEAFGEVEEDESKKIVTYSLPVSAVEKVKKIALDRNVSMSDIIAEAIDNL